jgi:hypothetical protein
MVRLWEAVQRSWGGVDALIIRGTGRLTSIALFRRTLRMVYYNKGRGEIRKEDLPQYKLLEKNKPVINGLIDRLTGGQRRSSVPETSPEHGSKSFYIGKASGAIDEKELSVVKISFNGRVLLVDERRARQLLHFGNIASVNGQKSFILATSDNGYTAPLEPRLCALLQDLDGLLVSGEDAESALVQEISARLKSFAR